MEVSKLTLKHREFLKLIQEKGEVSSVKKLCDEHGLDYSFIKGVLGSGLVDEFISLEEIPLTCFSPSKKAGSFERVPGLSLLEHLSSGDEDFAALQNTLSQAIFARDYSALAKERAVEPYTSGVSKRIRLTNPDLLTSFRERQQTFERIRSSAQIETAGDDSTSWLMKQGLITARNDSDYRISAKELLKKTKFPEVVTSLTSQLIVSGGWKNVELKSYNIHDPVRPANCGRPSLIGKYLEKIRSIFLDMGFDEMTGKIVDSSFWNFDVLFTPQDHPAREIQDTFYLENPSELALPGDGSLIERVQNIHETSYDYKWNPEAAKKSVLRTHTTSSTARKLHELRGKGGRFFSVDKVFRNETVDPTHLAEFTQIEGVAIGEGYTLQHLTNYLRSFYERLGFQNIKFKPTYNPYTEPSLEVLAKHPSKDALVEVGNSGMFRPEVLNPLGYEGKSAVAWGLGLERIAMICSDVPQLTDLVGPQININLKRKGD